MALRDANPGVEVLEASDLADAFKTLASVQAIQLVLLDLDLENTKGADTLRRLKSWTDDHDIEARVVVLSGRSEVDLVREVISLYGTGFILKATSRQVFQQAIALTLAGGVYIPEVVLHQLGGKEENRPASIPARPATLTPREVEIAALLVQGFTYKRIARELERADGKPISDHTVRAHVGNIAWKLGVTENAKSGVMAEIARRGLTFPLPIGVLAARNRSET